MNGVKFAFFFYACLKSLQGKISYNIGYSFIKGNLYIEALTV